MVDVRHVTQHNTSCACCRRNFQCVLTQSAPQLPPVNHICKPIHLTLRHPYVGLGRACVLVWCRGMQEDTPSTVHALSSVPWLLLLLLVQGGTLKEQALAAWAVLRCKAAGSWPFEGNSHTKQALLFVWQLQVTPVCMPTCPARQPGRHILYVCQTYLLGSTILLGSIK